MRFRFVCVGGSSLAAFGSVFAVDLIMRLVADPSIFRLVEDEPGPGHRVQWVVHNTTFEARELASTEEIVLCGAASLVQATTAPATTTPTPRPGTRPPQ